MNKEDLELLERLVDKYSLVGVVDGLEDICFQKSEHIAHNWQDVPLAKEWFGHGTLIGNISKTLRLRGTV